MRFSTKRHMYTPIFFLYLMLIQTNKKIQQNTHQRFGNKDGKKKDECLEQSTSNPTLSNIRHGQTSYTGSRSSMVIRHAGHFLHLSEQSLQRKQMAQRQYIMNRLWPDRLFKL